jgi:hypothetical protein
MPSRSFPAKYESECPYCHETILEGDELWYRNRNDKSPSHVTCPKSYAPPATSVGEGPKPGQALDPRAKAELLGTGVRVPMDKAAPAAASPGDTIYTYHRTLFIYWQGLQVGKIEQGVSVKGRRLLHVEIEEVDEIIRLQSNFNEKGETWK